MSQNTMPGQMWWITAVTLTRGKLSQIGPEFEASLYYTVTLYSNEIHQYLSRLFGTTKYQVVCFNENPNTLDNSRSQMSAQVTGYCIALHGP